MEEIWKDVPNYEGLYKVSNLGRVLSLSRYVPNSHRTTKDKILSTKSNTGNYSTLYLSDGDSVKYYNVHRLVAEAFIPNPKNLPEVNHKDGNRANNCVDNLEWCTHQENIQHAVNTGLLKCNKESNLIQVEKLAKIRGMAVISYPDNIEFNSVSKCCKYYHITYVKLIRSIVDNVDINGVYFQFTKERDIQYIEEIRSGKIPVSKNIRRKNSPYFKCLTTNQYFYTMRDLSVYFNFDEEGFRLKFKHSNGFPFKYCNFEFIQISEDEYYNKTNCSSNM